MDDKNKFNIIADTEVTNIPSQKEDNLKEGGDRYEHPRGPRVLNGINK